VKVKLIRSPVEILGNTIPWRKKTNCKKSVRGRRKASTYHGALSLGRAAFGRRTCKVYANLGRGDDHSVDSTHILTSKSFFKIAPVKVGVLS